MYVYKVSEFTYLTIITLLGVSDLARIFSLYIFFILMFLCNFYRNKLNVLKYKIYICVNFRLTIFLKELQIKK